MDIQKLPLTTRLNNLKSGYAAHPEYVAHSIQTMAETPMQIYFHASRRSQLQISRLLHLTAQEAETLTYQEIACRIAALRKIHPVMAYKTVEIIAEPLRKCYQERKDAYGKSDSAD